MAIVSKRTGMTAQQHIDRIDAALENWEAALETIDARQAAREVEVGGKLRRELRRDVIRLNVLTAVFVAISFGLIVAMFEGWIS